MLDIIVLDIETTGLNPEIDLILEIGIVKVNLYTDEISKVFYSLVKEKKFSIAYKNSKIFKDKVIKFSDIEKAPLLEDIFQEIQKIFDNNFITAYNEEFDFTFLRNREFKILNILPCLMIQSTNAINKLKKAYRKSYKMEYVFRYLYNKNKFVQKHRAYDDALHEAQILIKLNQLGYFAEFKFSSFLQNIYEKVCQNIDLTKKFKSIEVHDINTQEKAEIYLNSMFPLHLPKTRFEIHYNNVLNTSSNNILIIDFCCGPLTFTQAILEEIYHYHIKYYKNKSITIIGFDKSKFILEFAEKMIGEWSKYFLNKNINFEYHLYNQDLNFDDFKTYIFNNTNKLTEYTIIIGFSAAISSIQNDLSNYLLYIINNFNNAIVHGFIIEPENYRKYINDLEIFCKSNALRIKQEQHVTTCTKPSGMNYNLPLILSKYSSIYLYQDQKKKIDLIKLLEDGITTENNLIIFNKTKYWQKTLKFQDNSEIFLYESLFSNSISYLKKFSKSIPLQFYNIYNTRKGIKPDKYREISLIPLTISFLCFLILEKVGKDLDELLTKNVMGSRINKNFRLNRIYEYFTIGYSKFCLFELNFSNITKNLYEFDIEKFFPSINRKVLDAFIEENLIKINYITEIIKIFNNLVGESKGIPINLPLSPLIANLYLIKVDSEILNKTNILDFARYMDDFKIIFRENENKDIMDNIFKEILNRYLLNLNQEKTNIKLINPEERNYKIHWDMREISKEYQDLRLQIIRSLKEFSNRTENLSPETINKTLKFYHQSLKQSNLCFDFYEIDKYWDLIRKLKKSHLDPSEIMLFIPNPVDQETFNAFYNRFKVINKNYLKALVKFTQKIKYKLDKELKKWRMYFNKINELLSRVGQKENEQIKKELNMLIESKEFLTSLRFISFLLYRITRIKDKGLYDKKNSICRYIFKYHYLFISLKNIALFYYSYSHIDRLFDILKLYEDKHPFVKNEYNTDMRLAFSDDIAYVLLLFSEFYQEYPNKFRDDYQFWQNKIKEYLEDNDILLNISAIEFLIRTKNVDLFPYNYYFNLLDLKTDFCVGKSIILCMAYHTKGPYDFDKPAFEKILRSKNKDNVILALLKDAWSQIKLKKIDFVNTPNILKQIKNLPDDFDIEEEFLDSIDFDELFLTDS